MPHGQQHGGRRSRLGVAEVNTLLMVGLSHRLAPIALLERATVRRGEQGPLLATRREAGYTDSVVLSTCSRTEIYAIPGSASAKDLLTVLADTPSARGLTSNRQLSDEPISPRWNIYFA
jgi:glutamyl-tRNA reductase